MLIIRLVLSQICCHSVTDMGSLSASGALAVHVPPSCSRSPSIASFNSPPATPRSLPSPSSCSCAPALASASPSTSLLAAK